MREYQWAVYQQRVLVARGHYYNQGNIQMHYSAADGGECLKMLPTLSDLARLYPHADAFVRALICDGEWIYSSSEFGTITVEMLDWASELMQKKITLEVEHGVGKCREAV